MVEKKSIREIITHPRPHFDEVFAIWLLKKFGEEKFPGISSAKISFLAQEIEPPLDFDKKMEQEGKILVGIGGGRFDEHPTLQKEGKIGECAATLVAKDLGVEKLPELQRMLEFVRNHELKGAGHPFDIDCMMKVLYQYYEKNPEKVIEWAMVAIEAKYQEQVKFFSQTQEEFKKKAKIEIINLSDGRKIKLVVIVSDDERMHKFARYQGAGIFVQKGSQGNVQIHTNKKDRIDLYDVVKVIRLKEQEKKGRILTKDWEDLVREGRVEGAEEWWFDIKAQRLLNGSLTIKAPPTHLSLEEIIEAIKIGIDDTLFHPSFSKSCKKGMCLSTLHKPCPWYRFGLLRCRKIRWRMKHRQKGK